MPKQKSPKQNIQIYQAKNGAIELTVDAKKETVWATQAQMADVFGVERSVITKHIGNIINDKELKKNSVCAKFAHTASDGKVYQVQFYNLDVILAVGYRTNSKTAIAFRQWATKVLRQHITKGYSLNKKVLKNNYQNFFQAIEDVKKILSANQAVGAGDVLELVKFFADTWFSLDAYDKEELPLKGVSKKKVTVTAEKITKEIEQLKQNLLKKKQASAIFATERERGSLAGIVGNVFQSFGGKAAYPTVEEKAAHLLYFIVKNHPFIDGNKRSGAFVFVWFLQQMGFNPKIRIAPSALTTLTILVAESSPQEKDRIVGLILLLLKK